MLHGQQNVKTTELSYTTRHDTTQHDKTNLHVSLKSCSEVEEATTNCICLSQEAAQQATAKVVYKKML